MQLHYVSNTNCVTNYALEMLLIFSLAFVMNIYEAFNDKRKTTTKSSVFIKCFSIFLKEYDFFYVLC